MASTTGAGEPLSHAVSNPEWPLAWLTSFPPATVRTGHRAGDRQSMQYDYSAEMDAMDEVDG